MWFWAALLGWVAGIGLNSLADDLPPDEHAPDAPRALRTPHCRACGLGWPFADWSALTQWLARRGRCRYCAATRGWRAPLVEALTALAFVYLWAWSAGEAGRFLSAAVVVWIFFLIAVIDLEHRLILWRVVWVAALGLTALGAVTPDHGWAKTLIGGAVGFGLVFGLYLLGLAYTWLQARWRGQPLDEIAFGGGDVNLAGLIGLAVGWSGVLLALLIGVVSAGLFSLGYLAVMVARRRYNPHTPFAYGPFLVLGALAVYLHGRELAALWLRGR